MRLLLLALILTACGQETGLKERSLPPPPQPDTSLVATIPYGCTAVVNDGNLASGSHMFPGNNLQYAVPFDCGVREGTHCYYYVNINTATGVKLEDVRCE